MFTLKDPRVGRLWTELLGSDYDAVPRRTRVLFERSGAGLSIRSAPGRENRGLLETARCGGSLVVARLPGAYRPGPISIASSSGGSADARSSSSSPATSKNCSARLRGRSTVRSHTRCLASSVVARRLVASGVRGAVVRAQRSSFGLPGESGCSFPNAWGTTPKLHGGEVRCDAPIACLTTAGDRIEGLKLQSGEACDVDFVVSALPLPLTARLVDSAYQPDSRQRARFRSVLLVYLLVDAQSTFRDQWVFLAPRRFKSSRVTNFQSWSSPAAGGSQAVLSVEFWCDRSDSLWSAADRDLQELAVEELRNAGVLKQQAVVDGQVVRLGDSFPVPVVGYSEVLTGMAARVSRFANLTVTAGFGAIANVGVHGSLVAGMEAGDAAQRALSPAGR